MTKTKLIIGVGAAAVCVAAAGIFFSLPQTAGQNRHVAAEEAERKESGTGTDRQDEKTETKEAEANGSTPETLEQDQTPEEELDGQKNPDQIQVAYGEENEAQREVQEQEEKFKQFLADALFGNGIQEDGTAKQQKLSVSLKNFSDAGGYITFTCQIDKTDLEMTYYKSNQTFAFREGDATPGRTNAYQVVPDQP